MNFSIPIHRSPDDLVALGAPIDRTVGDLLNDVDLLSAVLIERLGNIRRGDEILLICSDRYHFAAGLLAIWKRGLAAALPPNGQPETVHALAAQPAIRLLLHDTDSTEGLDLRTFLTGRSLDMPAAGCEALSIAPDQAIAVLYTSGSTGEHKRCPKTAAELLGEAAAHVESFHIEQGERFVATVPGHHIYGLLWSVLVPLLSGSAFARQTPFYPEAVAARLTELDATHLISVPAHLRALAELDTLPCLRRIVSSSASLPAETAHKLFDRFGQRVTEIFGSSETGGIAFREEPDAPHTPLAGVKVSVDAEGRLLVDSPFLAPEALRPMPCDDRIEHLVDGRFFLKGRIDGVIKVGGKRIALAEIERRLLQIDGMKDAACLAEPVNSGRDVELWAAVVAPSLGVQQIKGQLKGWLDPVTLPRRFQFVDALPREENGKLKRSKLRALFAPAATPTLFRFADAPIELIPLKEEVIEDGSGYVLTFHIPEDFHYFRGHFDGLPILPGVVQLETIVRRQIARLWPDLKGGLRRIAQLKFKQTIGPGTELTLTLRRAPTGSKVHFELKEAANVCSQGQFCF